MSVSERILQTIGTGESGAVSAEQLTMITGLTSRELRKAVETLRRDGYVIISSDNGYYYPETVEEVKRYIGKESRRARSIFFTLRSARELLNRWTGGSGSE